MDKTVKVQMCIESPNPDELRRIIDHHMDYLIDMDDSRDIITSVHSAMSYIVGTKHDAPRLRMLSSILEDITDVSIDEMTDDDEIELYQAIENLKTALDRIGY